MKRVLAGLLMVLFVVSVSGCVTQPAPAPSATSEVEEIKSATGTAEGYGGPLTVTVKTQGKTILEVLVSDHKETVGVSDAAIQELPQNIVKAQSVAIDTMSGCTLASNAVLEAAKQALLSLGFTDSEITREVEKAAPGEEIVKTADVIVIGTGGAGMTAAYTAAKNGASVIVIDKMTYVGGNTLAAGSSINAADPEMQNKLEMEPSELSVVQKALELEPRNEWMKAWQDDVRKDIDEYVANQETYLYDSPSLHALQTYVGGDYVANPELVDLFAKQAPDAIRFLNELGARWKNIYAGMGATWRRTHGTEQDWGSNGAAFVLPQKEAYEKLGGEILLNYTAQTLLTENGRVTGVTGVVGDGTPFRLMAEKGIVLATGGFAANVELRERVNKHWPTLGAHINTTNVASSTGDGILMAEEVGANLIDMEWIQMAPAASKMETGLSASINNVIYINQEGKRFVKEDGRRDDMSAAILEQTDGVYYWLSDMHLYREIGGLTSYGKQIDDAVDGENLIKTDTLEEMAAIIGCDAATLTETVSQYNTCVDNNVDTDFGRAVFGGKLDEGPFYALKGEARVHYTMGGVEINSKAQVLDKTGAAIPGLYAAGEVTGGIHGANRLGGNAIADIVVFGKIAGENVSK